MLLVRYTEHMNINHKKIIVGGLGILVVCILIVAGILYQKAYNKKQIENTTSYMQEVSKDNPVDIVLDFYLPWLNAVKSTSTDPYTSGFASEKILSTELSARLMSTKEHAETEADPVLCQTTVPERVSGRIVSTQENETRVLVVAKDTAMTAQSVFTLKRYNDGWFIDNISCTPGEFDTPREFSFEKEGHLLKSVPPPLDPQYWHIVFEDNGVPGHFAPLFFDTTSMCTAIDKTETVCNPDTFVDAEKIHLYGQMTERGVEVKKIQFFE